MVHPYVIGLLLAETKYKYQVEADIAPFRGLLLGNCDDDDDDDDDDPPLSRLLIYTLMRISVISLRHPLLTRIQLHLHTLQNHTLYQHILTNLLFSSPTPLLITPIYYRIFLHYCWF